MLAGLDFVMPGCVLRVGSKTTDVELLIKASRLKPIALFRKGHPRVPGSTRLNRESGFNVDVSKADAFEKQAQDATRFLKRYAAGLTRLRSNKKSGGMTLDFGVYDRATKERPWASYRLPAALIELAGKHGIEIELPFYGPG
jgi:hypothetical protein